jgi:hypothetical protein
MGEDKKMIRFIDIDGTICDTIGNDYERAIPNHYRIDLVDQWYDEGDYIVYWTARGATTKKDWRELTEKQLLEWCCKYHELRMDKPAFDALYDDRAFNAEVMDK